MTRLAILCLLFLSACAQTAPSLRSQLTRAQIDSVDEPVLFAEISGTGAAALASPVGFNGGVETWATADQVSVSFRDGVLVATRGLGHDLMSADVTNTLRALRGGTGAFYTRFHSYLDGENTTQFRSFQCEVTARARETITIFERAHTTTRVEETCFSPGLRVENSFWVDDGIVWKSRQWISPQLGYLATERLVR